MAIIWKTNDIAPPTAARNLIQLACLYLLELIVVFFRFLVKNFTYRLSCNNSQQNKKILQIRDNV